MALKNVKPENLVGDLVPPDDPRYGLIWINPKRMSGEPCFFGTRVPIQTLWDYLEHDYTLDEFLDHFPGVEREQALAVIKLASSHVLDGLVRT
jgi:uncharacterized protein (DUF433 family)